MSLRLQLVRVRTSREGVESQLVFADGDLVAVLVHLSDEYRNEAGMWFLETGFGPVDGPDHSSFPDLHGAQDWIVRGLLAPRCAAQ
jgi:hypothetical protein